MSYINTVVDKVYVINLDSDKERLATIDENLNALQIRYSRFPAIKGAALSKEDKRFSPLCNSFCSVAQRGCAASHHTIWMEMLENKYDSVLILEDDAVLSPDINDQVRYTLERIPRDWDALYLGCIGFCSKKEAFDSALQNTLQLKPEHVHGTLHKVPGSIGTHGMIVRKSFVEKVKDLPINATIDNQITLWNSLLSKSDTPLKLYGLYPQAIKQSSMEGHNSVLGDSYPPILLGALQNIPVNSAFNLDWFISERFLQIGPFPISLFVILVFIVGFVLPIKGVLILVAWFILEAIVGNDFKSMINILFFLAIGPIVHVLIDPTHSIKMFYDTLKAVNTKKLFRHR